MRVSKAVKNLVYLFILINPGTDAKKLHEIWKQDKVLAEYDRPTLETLQLWCADVQANSTSKKAVAN